ncbi:MAG: DUF3108 domain-containing protein [Acetobacteraceae bacterium]
MRFSPIAAVAAAAFVVIPPTRAAEPPVLATYTAYFSGFTVMTLDASLGLDAERYRAVAQMRTAGLLAVFLRGEQTAVVEGRVGPETALGLAPERYGLDGRWRDRVRRIAMRWQGGTPEVLTLIPANDEERDPVPLELQRGTVDAMSALVGLLHRVARTGRCDGAAAVFDGRRRTDFTARTEGEEELAAHRWGSYAGRALKCGFEGRQVAGFWREADPAQAREPRGGAAWFARPGPGLPMVPVRIEAETNWGTVHVHLTRIGFGDLPAPTRESRN